MLDSKRDRCWLTPKGEPITVRRNAAIGDVIASTVVADRLAALGYSVTYQCHPAIAPLLKRCDNVVATEATKKKPQIDLDGAYEDHPSRTTRHFSDLFLEAANEQLRSRRVHLGGPHNAMPSLRISPKERLQYQLKLAQHPHPWIWICPRSQSWPNRTVQPHVWKEAARMMPGTKFWLGQDPAPEGIVDLEVRNIWELPLWLACGDILVSVDTGPLHVGAAVGLPCVALEQASAPELHLSDRRDFIVLRIPHLDCLNCQQNVCPKAAHLPPCQEFAPEHIAAAVNARLRAQTSEDVSCVIPIYRPPVERLTRCLELVLPQVAEVVVTCDAGGIVPPGAPLDPRIRYVRHRQKDLGFGKNVNFGFRHTHGKHVLVLNDDVFLQPDAVQRMKEVMSPEVGLVGHRLHYEDGRIQHAGKYRMPGMKGWGHQDHKKFKFSVLEPLEVENVTGASILVRRTAFYAAGGFDEDFYMYAEDDALCLQMRQKGYRIMYTPHAVGTHLESQSAILLPNHHDRIQEGNRIFWQKWGWWIEANINRIPGLF